MAAVEVALSPKFHDHVTTPVPVPDMLISLPAHAMDGAVIVAVGGPPTVTGFVIGTVQVPFDTVSVTL